MRNRTLVLLALLPFALTARASDRSDREGRSEREGHSKQWLPEELPLQVRKPADLGYKQIAEREYLLLNLLVSAKVAYDAGRFSEAADQWDSLLQLADLDPRIDKVVRPLAVDARQKAGQPATVTAATPAPAPAADFAALPPPEADDSKEGRHKRSKSGVDISGTVTGGGSNGPGGAVVWLKRADGKTPAPPTEGEFVMNQSNKTFDPHVLAVPVGASVAFVNKDPIYHDVFSVTTPNDFDLGLYKSGQSRSQTFGHAGPVQLYCNIHAAMNAWVVVVDSPWYAIADANGKFRIRNVPPGDYKIKAWHEASSKDTENDLTVSASTSSVAIAVGSDRRPLAYPPDKYGKPRQAQLGY